MVKSRANVNATVLDTLPRRHRRRRDAVRRRAAARTRYKANVILFLVDEHPSAQDQDWLLERLATGGDSELLQHLAIDLGPTDAAVRQ